MKNTDLDMSFFYTGLITPDVRYLQGLPWEQTHPSIRNLQNILGQLPPKNIKEKSFNLGYSIHLITDFMFHVFTNTLKINPVLVSLLLEQYYLKHHPIKDIDFKIPEKSALIDSFSIERDKLKLIITFCQEYVESPNIQRAFNLVPEDLRQQLNKYTKTAQGSAKFINIASIIFTPLFWYINRKIIKHLNKIKS